MNIRTLLSGLTVGEMQSVGHMQVVPLLSDTEDTSFVSPKEYGKMRTTGYGNMEFTNTTQKTMIVPAHASYIVAQAAQNHAMAMAGLIKAQAAKLFDNAQCIQQSQGGYIASGVHEFSILPFQLREKANELRKQKNFQKLWEPIAALNSKFGLTSGRGHLEVFVDTFKKELDEFVAEFEVVPNQVGAIILIDGQVVGVERAPNYQYWLEVWRPLIRVCYGSIALEVERSKTNKPETRLDLGNVKTLSGLLKSVKNAKKREKDAVKSVVDSLLDTEFAATSEDSCEGATLYHVDNAQFSGQAVVKGSEPAFCSLVVKGKYSSKVNINPRAARFEF